MVKTYVPCGVYLPQSLVIKVPPSPYRSYKPSLKLLETILKLSLTNPQSLGKINRDNGKKLDSKRTNINYGRLNDH